MRQKLDQQGIANRVRELIAEAMCSDAMYAKRIGIDPGNFHKKLIGIQKWTINDVKKICSTDNVSKEWLVGGIGEARPNNEYKPEMALLPSDFTPTTNEQSDEQTSTKPRIPTVAMAGPLSEYIDGIRRRDCEELPTIHQMPSYDFTIIIKGNSMEPKYEGGDEIACKQVFDYIEWGKTYVVSTRDGALLKRLYDAGDKIRCVSYNTEEYPDFYIEKSSDLKFYKIVGLIRTNF